MNSPLQNSGGSADDVMAQRLSFVDFTEEDRSALRGMRATLGRSIGPALDRFYRRIRSTPQTSRFFSGDDHVSRAKGAQSNHWDAIA